MYDNAGLMVKFWRNARGISRAQLAHRAQIRTGTIATWERGRTARPALDSLVRVAQALDLDPTALVASAGYCDYASTSFWTNPLYLALQKQRIPVGEQWVARAIGQFLRYHREQHQQPLNVVLERLAHWQLTCQKEDWYDLEAGRYPWIDTPHLAAAPGAMLAICAQAVLAPATDILAWANRLSAPIAEQLQVNWAGMYLVKRKSPFWPNKFPRKVGIF